MTVKKAEKKSGAKHPGGRPSKFTPQVCEDIIRSISNHVPYKLAAHAAGIGEETLYEWLKDGLADLENGIDTPKAEFAKSIKSTEENTMRIHLDKIDASDSWQAHAWLLERRWWKYFSSNAAVVEFNKQIERFGTRSVKDDKINDS